MRERELSVNLLADTPLVAEGKYVEPRPSTTSGTC
jgi:hypothetical protein